MENSIDIKRMSKTLKKELRTLEVDFKEVIEADVHNKARMTKLKRFFNESQKSSDNDRWAKLE